jgi:hypothetical protein
MFFGFAVNDPRIHTKQLEQTRKRTKHVRAASCDFVDRSNFDLETDRSVPQMAPHPETIGTIPVPGSPSPIV